MTSSLPPYSQQPSPQTQIQTPTSTGNRSVRSNNPFLSLSAQPTGAAIQSNATALPSFQEATATQTATATDRHETHPNPTSASHNQSTISNQNTSSSTSSNPFDDLSILDPEQHMTAANSVPTNHPTSTSSPTGNESISISNNNAQISRTSDRTPSPPISPIETSSPSPPSPEQPQSTRPTTPPLVIPPDIDSPPDSHSASIPTSSVSPTVYDPPNSPPPPLASTSSSNSIYQPPPGPPPQLPHRRTASSQPYSSQNSPSQSNRLPPSFRPTTVPTPGQPLLRNGRILIYPPSFHCPKCQNCGFKRFDPTHPCRKCWDKYSKEYSSAMAYSVGLGGATLQKPLPSHHQVIPPPQHGLMGRPLSHANVPVSYPGGAMGNQAYGSSSPAQHFPVQQPQTQPYHHTPVFRPPQSPPSSSRPGPPAVNRADDDGIDGEAPPAYDQAVTSERPLPPQHSISSGSFSPPPGPPPPAPQPHGAPTPAPAPFGPPQGYQPFQSPGFGYGHVAPPGAHPHLHHGAPPRPLVLQPGDPRIGGHLCYKCGGRGLKESFWFGDETCYVCNGMGRVFR